MRTPPLLADFIHARPCKPFCEKLLTLPLNTYKAEKDACNELLLKTKNAYAAVLAQAKQKQDEQAQQDSRTETAKAIFDADTLITDLAELLIDRVLVYPDRRIEIAYKIQDIFD